MRWYVMVYAEHGDDLGELPVLVTFVPALPDVDVETTVDALLTPSFKATLRNICPEARWFGIFAGSYILRADELAKGQDWFVPMDYIYSTRWSVR